MKNLSAVLLLLICLLLPSLSARAYNFVSILKLVEGQKPLPILSLTYPLKGGEAEIRYNFDQPKSLGVFAGPAWSWPMEKDSSRWLNLTPSGGIILGDYQGISPQLASSVRTKTSIVFLLNQYSLGLNRHPDFTFHYLEMGWRVNKHLVAGAGGQLFHEFSENSQTQVDIGPQLMYFRWGNYLGIAKNLTVKVWGTLGTEPEGVKKLFVFFTFGG